MFWIKLLKKKKKDVSGIRLKFFGCRILKAWKLVISTHLKPLKEKNKRRGNWIIKWFEKLWKAFLGGKF